MRRTSRAPLERSQEKRGSGTRSFREAMATAVNRHPKICQIYFVVFRSFLPTTPNPLLRPPSARPHAAPALRRKERGQVGPGQEGFGEPVPAERVPQCAKRDQRLAREACTICSSPLCWSVSSIRSAGRPRSAGRSARPQSDPHRSFPSRALTAAGHRGTGASGWRWGR